MLRTIYTAALAGGDDLHYLNLVRIFSMSCLRLRKLLLAQAQLGHLSAYIKKLLDQEIRTLVQEYEFDQCLW